MTASPQPHDALWTAVAAAGLIDDTGDTEWRRLTGGYHNDVYLVGGRRGPLVVKHFVAGSTNPLFPQLPNDEYRALRHLAGRAIAPDPVGFIADVSGRAVLIYRYVDGEMWTTGVGEVGRLLRRVHDVPLPDGLRSLPSSSMSVMQQARSIAESIGHPWVTSTSDWGRLCGELAMAGLSSAEPGPTLVHTDCGPGNIVVADDGLRLIDWQCPGVGDPVEDLAAFASPAIQLLYRCRPLDTGSVSELLEGYGDSSAVERFPVARRAFHIRFAAYCAYRIAELSVTDPAVAARYASALTAELDLLESL